ncbi:hypothetical protein [Erwinia amylovora]|nr:hypothetical protein [Erwinia amylovora]CDK14606.1 hypothetical protein LA635_0982 [Erwinia amylovora LA635]CDK17974.1 hypothetical protein LA636_0982 [Erwinia amylovora LA636]CDK21343.1 hypothetical protein LA637_0983 [Erwinia amylovora LA637]ATZ13254.1 hypothetical protein AD997_05400 [Erwinia amylovora]MBZ2388799.1 hypothetical protein [Erwinia amylovora]
MAQGGAQREETNRALAVVATETQVTVKQVDHRVKKSTKPDLSRSDGDEIARSYGLDPKIFSEYFINSYGEVIGICPDVGGDAFGVNLGPAPAEFSAISVPNRLNSINNGKPFGPVIRIRSDLPTKEWLHSIKLLLIMLPK